MEIRRAFIGGRIVGMLVLCMGMLLVAGCGDDSTEPTPEVTAMGGILIPYGEPAGTPHQVGVVVTVDGQVVTDAEVQINGTDLMYVDNPQAPETSGYIGMIPASEGDVLTLSFTAAGQSGSHEATVPGMVEIQSPTPGSTYTATEEIPVSWTPSSGAAYTVVTCGGATSNDPGMWMLGKDASSHRIPAEYTTIPGSRITVIAASGSGHLPTSMDMRDWTGKDGFWATCQDFVDVMITN